MTLLIVLSACSILEDSDVTTQGDLTKLKLNGIEVRHSINGVTTKRGAPVVDETVSISSGLGQLTRRITITWPDLEANAKFNFRSGVTNDIQIRLFFGTDGKIRYGYVTSGEINYEVYRFEYDGQGRLSQLATSITQNGTDYTTTQDIFDPPGGFFAIRISPDPAKRALLGGDFQYSNNCIVKMPYRYDWSTGDVYNSYKQYNYCDKDNFFIEPGGQSAQFYVIGDALVEEVYIAGTSTPSDPTCCLDKYYFHPLLFIPVDYELRIMYSPDWWAEDSTFGGKESESIKLNFYYVP